MGSTRHEDLLQPLVTVIFLRTLRSVQREVSSSPHIL
jgi:hypothetical protein